MDTPADPATPLSEVYQAIFADLAKEGTKQSTIDRYNIVRFEKWLTDNGHPAILASLERSILIAYTRAWPTRSSRSRTWKPSSTLQARYPISTLPPARKPPQTTVPVEPFDLASVPRVAHVGIRQVQSLRC